MRNLQPWPELPIPAGVDLDLFRHAVSGAPPAVWGEGNPDAGLALLLDNPGQRVDSAGTAWVCPTRQELRAALAEAGCPEPAAQIFFLYKFRPRRAYDRPSANALMVPVLAEQVRRSRSRTLLALGNTVAKALLGPDADVQALRGRRLTWAGRPLFVSYHPLAARRRPPLHPLLVEDVRQALRATAQ